MQLQDLNGSIVAVNKIFVAEAHDDSDKAFRVYSEYGNERTFIYDDAQTMVDDYERIAKIVNRAG
jgi:hypothetical protein